MNTRSQHGAPIFIKDGKSFRLKNVRLGQPDRSDDRREDFLQELVHKYPDLIPIDEIEPAFSPLISVCTELTTTAGNLDNLWITPAGALILGECKLVRNPQSRREVVAQGLDYARAIAGWGYDDLETAAQKAARNSNLRLWELVRPHADLDEAAFVDAVERRLRTGAVLVLIICDGIHEGVEALVSHLQMHAGVHAGLALIDLSVWDSPDGGSLVVPRIPLRTVLIERGIVRVENSIARIDPPDLERPKTPLVARPTSASEPEFYNQLADRFPELPAQLKAFVESLSPLGIQPEFGRSLFLRWQGADGDILSAATVEPTGSVWLSKAASDARSVGRTEAGETYLQTVADLVGGSLRRSGSSVEARDAADKAIRISALMTHADKWRDAIATFVERLRE